MQTRRFMIVDVFTDRPLAGNQLGVFSNASGMSDELMQSLAAELGFSETTFVTPAEKDGDIRLRVFTPKQEIPFSGHPTLGTAFALAGPLQSSVIRIETDGGTVPVVLEREGAKVVFGRMEQPVPKFRPMDGTSEELFEALGVNASILPVEIYDNSLSHCYVTLASFAEVAAIKPDIGWLSAFFCGTVSVCAIQNGRVKTRCFTPGIGVGEDAATGSAAGPLALHLARHGVIPWGKTIEISQGAELGRPSTLYACAYGDGETAHRVEVGGSAVVVARGEFLT